MTSPAGSSCGDGQDDPAASLSRRSFSFDVTTLAGATSLSHALALMAAPIVSRLFPDWAFGEWATLNALVLILGSVACMRYHLAVVLPKQDADAQALMAGSLGILILWSSAIGLVLWWWQAPVSRCLKLTTLSPSLPWVAVLVFLSGLVMLIDSWLVRTRAYLAKGAQRVTTTGVEAIGNITFGLRGLVSAPFLMYSRVAGLVLGLLAQLVACQGRARLTFPAWTVRRIGPQLWQYRKFALVDTWAGMLNVLSISLAPLVLAVFFPREVVGQYSRCLLLVQLPITLIGESVGHVFYQRAAHAGDDSILQNLVRRMVVTLLALGLFIFSLIAVLGRELFQVVLGSNWGPAGDFSSALSLWCLLVFVGSPLSTLLFIQARQEINLIFNVLTVVLRTAALVAGGFLGDPMIAVVLFAASGVLLWLGLILYLLKLAGVTVGTILREVRTPLILGAGWVPLLVILKLLLHESPVLLLGFATTLMAVIYGLMFRLQPGLREILAPILDRLFRPFRQK